MCRPYDDSDRGAPHGIATGSVNGNAHMQTAPDMVSHSRLTSPTDGCIKRENFSHIAHGEIGECSNNQNNTANRLFSKLAYNIRLLNYVFLFLT